MAIWYKNYRIEELNRISQGSMVGHLGIEFTEIGEDYLKARMPVDHRTTQPLGLLHGGASVTLAESLGSTGAFLCINPEEKIVVGLEINANHIRGKRGGQVEGIARPVHIGNSTQVWEVRIVDEAGDLICISRLTLAILDRNRSPETENAP